MSDILIGVVITLVTGLLLGVVILVIEYKTNIFHKEPKKELTATLIWEHSLANVAPGFENEFEVHWKGKRLETPQVLQAIIQITNTGTEEIRTSDYEEPIRIQITKGEILYAIARPSQQLDIEIDYEDPVEVVWRSPTSTKNELVRRQDIIIKPLLINEGESFTIAILVNGPYGIATRARIAGVRKLEITNEYATRFKPDNRRQFSMMGLIMILAIILGSFAFVIVLVVQGRPLPPTGDMLSTLEAIDAEIVATAKARAIETLYATTPTP